MRAFADGSSTMRAIVARPKTEARNGAMSAGVERGEDGGVSQSVCSLVPITFIFIWEARRLVQRVPLSELLFHC